MYHKSLNTDRRGPETPGRASIESRATAVTGVQNALTTPSILNPQL